MESCFPRQILVQFFKIADNTVLVAYKLVLWFFWLPYKLGFSLSQYFAKDCIIVRAEDHFVVVDKTNILDSNLFQLSLNRA